MKINSFEELEIWEEAVEIVKDIYRVTRNFKKDYALRTSLGSRLFLYRLILQKDLSEIITMSSLYS